MRAEGTWSRWTRRRWRWTWQRSSGGSAEGTSAALAAAAQLYQGDLLAGLSVEGAGGFEEWLLGERERLRELALEGLAKLLAQQRAAGAAEAAIQTGLHLLGLDPLQEPGHRALMRLYAAAGRRGAALRQYQACVAVLQRELGVEPEAETRQLYQEILRERPEIARSRAIARASGRRPRERPVAERRSSGGMRSGAPADGSSTGGRADGRVVAVLGEAGIGKSRLAESSPATPRAPAARVLLGRSYESEQILAFGPWVDALRAAQDSLRPTCSGGLGPVWRAELARLLPELAGRARPAGAATRTPAGSSRRGAADRRSWPRAATLRRPRGLALGRRDERPARRVHRAPPRGRPVLLVATAREEELTDAPALRGALDELERDRGSRR